MKLGIARWGLLAMVAGSLAGCLGGGGGGDSPSTTTTTPPPSSSSAVTSQPPTLQSGTAVTNISTLTPSQFADLSFDTTKTKVTGATVSSPPKVYFNLVDAAGNPITGMTTNNLQFAIAKLVPGSNGSPSRWVSYMVISSAGALSKPGTETAGTLTDNGNGSYVYTFANDITTAKARVDAASAGTNNKADLDDLTYNANLTHRIGIQISGPKPGYGTDSSVTGVIKTPIDLVYDFVPATSKEVAQTETDGAKQRNIVDIKNCFTCHVKFTFHGRRTPTTGQGAIDATFGIGGGRQDTKFCVLCHTDQRKYSVANAAITGTTIATGDRMKDFSMKNLPVWIHKIHMGENLVLQGYNASNIQFNHIRFPQDVRNCTKCHSDSTGGNNVPQADNWKNVPSRLVCGSCHDGIDFSTGAGTSVKGHTNGHIGGAQSSDQNCALCHTSAVVATQHLPVNKAASATMQFAASVNNLPTGAKVITYDLNSVTLNASRNPIFKFRFRDETASPATNVVFNTPSATAELMPNFTGTTNLYVAYGVPQDGVSNPGDWNAYVSGDIRAIFRGTATGTGAGTFAGPDASGYYTITLTGVTIPTDATLMTGWIGLASGLTQTNVSGYTALNVTAEAKKVVVTATGNEGRRDIVEAARCNSCHNKLGVFGKSVFHGGQRNNPQACNMCHNPNRSSSGWSAASTHYIHGIHGGSKRTVDFNWHSELQFAELGYPGLLRECRQCHLPNTVNFGAAANKSAAESSRLMPATAAQGTMSATSTASLSPWVTPGAAYGAVASNRTSALNLATAADSLVTSPIANACTGCHTTDPAMSHMRANGAYIYAKRSTLNANYATDGTLPKTEQCLVCHGAGKIVDAEVVHREPAGLPN